MTLTIACVWVRGHVPFSAEYVRRLWSMAVRHCDRPFRFVCLTDQPEQFGTLETIRISTPRTWFGWWSKIELFKPGRFSGRVLYLDLDTLIVSSLAPIIDFDAPFALVPDGAPNFHGKGELRVVKKYNSSVMVWNADARPAIYRAWSAAATTRLHGDQDWIGEMCPNEATMPLEWFPRISALTGPPWPDDAKVVLMKRPKNEEAARRWAWMKDWWR